MKLNKATEEMALRVAATLISDNVAAQEDWVERHQGKGYFVDNSENEAKYIVVSCFAHSYFTGGQLYITSPVKDCIRAVKVWDKLNIPLKNLFIFIGLSYVIFKKQPDGTYVEIPYECGFDLYEKVYEYKRAFYLPLPVGAKFWVDVDSERLWIDPPKSAFEVNHIDINRQCWMDCLYFESVMCGGEIDEDKMCEDCPIRDIMNIDIIKPFSLGVKKLNIKSECVKTERLLEVFAPSILRLRSECIREERYEDFGPSLSKQFEFVKSLKKIIYFDGNTIGFEDLGENNYSEQIEAYNFFLLSYIRISDSKTGFTIDLDINIHGFNTYSSLNKFILENLDYAEGFLLFIKDEGTYRETLCSLILKGPNETVTVSRDEFIAADEIGYTRKFDIPQLCEFYEVKGTIEEAQEFYEQDTVVIYGETIEKEIPFDYTVGLCNSKSEVESRIYCRNLNAKADLIEGQTKYGYVVMSDKNVFTGVLYRYFITCKDGTGSFEIKRVCNKNIIEVA